jgi:hypothetical protein
MATAEKGYAGKKQIFSPVAPSVQFHTNHVYKLFTGAVVL